MSKAICGKDRRMWGQLCGQDSMREVEVQRTRWDLLKSRFQSEQESPETKRERKGEVCPYEIGILIIKPTRCTNFSNLFLE